MQEKSKHDTTMENLQCGGFWPEIIEGLNRYGQQILWAMLNENPKLNLANIREVFRQGPTDDVIDIIIDKVKNGPYPR